MFCWKFASWLRNENITLYYFLCAGDSMKEVNKQNFWGHKNMHYEYLTIEYVYFMA